MRFAFIILAAGQSSRFKAVIPKQYLNIAGKSLLEISILKAKKIKEINDIIVVYNKKQKRFLDKINLHKVIKIQGGKTRQASTYNALRYLKKKKIDQVLIHDASRPNISINLIKKIIKESKKNRTVIPYLKVEDSLKFKKNSYYINQKREKFILTQTPQSFRFKDIYKIHHSNRSNSLSDDMSLLEKSTKIKLILADKSNFKITTKEDFYNFKKFFISKSYVGIGFDIHPLVKNRKLILGGISIPFGMGLAGHSDGDVVLHAVTDAILGASGLGSIGEYFSDKSKKYKNIDSKILLKNIINLIIKNNYYLNNLDINIICEQPKISKIKNKIIDKISSITELDKNRINVKGKTAEKLGIIGNQKAIASEVIVSLIKYD